MKVKLPLSFKIVNIEVDMFNSAPGFFENKDGVEKCFFCGNSCGEENDKNDYVKKTFTNHDEVKCPSSDYVCGGCVISMGMGQQGFDMIDGSYKVAKTNRGGAIRLNSWVLSGAGNLAADKSMFTELRAAVLSPPKPPFSIVVATSGQKQIIFRCPVSMTVDNFFVQMEEETICVELAKFKAIISIANKLSAACGKIALQNPNDVNFGMFVYDYYKNVDMAEQWLQLYATPMGRLASCLAMPKKEAQDEYQRFDTSGVPAAGCRGKQQKEEKENRPGNDRDMRQVSIFDSTFLRGRP